MKKNCQGFVLIETLIVAVFIVVIFTFLYTSIIPLLGTYESLMKADDIDICYKLYHIRNALYQEDNYETILNANYKKITSSDFTKTSLCRDSNSNITTCSETYYQKLVDTINLENYELIYIKYANNNANIDAVINDSSYSNIKDYLIKEKDNITSDILILYDDTTRAIAHLKMKNDEVIEDEILADVIQDDLTDSDGDETRFFTGDDPNNYVWYSGKLWRIVSLNSDKTIKLITQNNMAALSWNTTSSVDYSTSQIRSWLNNEFLPTIEQSLIINNVWDYTTDETLDKSKPAITNTVTDKVGLLTSYELIMTGATENSSTSKTFLDNGYAWWTMTPYSSSDIINGSHMDYVDHGLTTNSYGIRPAVVLKSDVELSGGTGTKNNPYTLKGDKIVATNGESLNTRLSGEYIKFNNALYRIVKTENIGGNLLTKVTMADYSINNNTINNVSFGASNIELTFSPLYGIGKYLDDWYNGTEINSTYKAMIAPKSDGIIWYTGPDVGIGIDYTLARTGTTVSATIGIASYGEMFSSQLGDGYSTSTDIWLITKYNDLNIWYMGSNGYGFAADESPSYGIRPSFYLQKDVKIVSGSGLPNDPYEISM